MQRYFSFVPSRLAQAMGRELPFRQFSRHIDALRKIAAAESYQKPANACISKALFKALSITHLFTEIHIDAIDESRPIGKLQAFEAIMQMHRLTPQEVLVVGDSPDSEIAAGNKLGITSIQILRPGVPPSSAATHQIRTLAELSRFL